MAGILDLFRKASAKPQPPRVVDTRPPQMAPAAPQRPPMASSPAPTRGIQVAFHLNLVDELEDDHRAMLAVFGGVGTAMKNEEWSRAAEQLLKLRSMLTDHLLKEGVKMYCYMQSALSEDDDAFTMFRQFKTEMGGIGKAAFSFVDRYAAPDALKSKAAQAAFREEYEAIGKVLVDRIKREESQLYPLYNSLAKVIL